MILGIDPGHGGESSGTTAAPIAEKWLTKTIAESLAESVPQACVLPELLRRGDETVSLRDRGLRSEGFGCHWVLSIHVNAHTDPSCHGAECYVLPACQSTLTVGRAILDAMPPHLRTKRIVVADPDESSRWLEAPRNVLSVHSMPAVLCEVGYASNAEDWHVLGSAWGRAAIVAALLAGVSRMLQDSSMPKGLPG